MIKKGILLFVLIFPQLLCAQEQDMDFLVDKFCEEYSKVEITNNPPQNIASEFDRINYELTNAHLDKIKGVLFRLMKDHPGLEPEKYEPLYSILLYEELFDHCHSFVTFFRTQYPPCPEESETFKLLNKEIEKLLMDNEKLSYTEQENLVINDMGKIIIKNEVIVEKDYEDGVVGIIADMNNLRNYLLHKNKRFLKAVTISSWNKIAGI